MPAVLTSFDIASRTGSALVRSPMGLLAHLREAVRAWRQEALEHEIGDFIARQGGRITDDLERQIGRRLG